MADLTRASPDIALMGRARAGKDSVAAYLCEAYGYTRVAFADPVRDAALKLDPWVVDSDEYDGGRLSELVRDFGWETAKDQWPEARRILQHMGQGVRDLDPDFWLDLAMGRVGALRDLGRPVVVTDMRYPNEYNALGSAGFRLVRVHRVGASAGAGATHPSETSLDRYHADVDLDNNGSLADLHAQIDWHAAA